MSTAALHVVVTGASGYLGAALTRGLAAQPGLEVTAFVRTGPLSSEPAHVAELDLTDERAVAEALHRARPHAVVHAAGLVRGTTGNLFLANVATTASLAEAMLKVCPEAVLTSLGSAAEYGLSGNGQPHAEDAVCRPTGHYGYAKLAAALYLAEAAKRGLKYNLVRVFNPVGVENSTEQVVGSFIQKAAAARAQSPPYVVRLGRLDAVRDYVVVDDLVQLVSRLVGARRSGVVVNACSGEGRRIRDIIEAIVKLSGQPLVVVEEGEAPASDADNIAVGDPTLFKTLLGSTRLTSFDETLAAAWRKASP